MSAPASQHPVITLVPVTRENRDVVAALAVADEQRHFVADNAESLSEADDDPGAEPRALIWQGHLIGFLMYDASDVDDVRIYRFMIDRAFQGRGFGKAALGAVLHEIASQSGARRISIVYEPDNEPARRLYGAAGFVEEGLDEDGEMIAALTLPHGPDADA